MTLPPQEVKFERFTCPGYPKFASVAWSERMSHASPSQAASQTHLFDWNFPLKLQEAVFDVMTVTIAYDETIRRNKGLIMNATNNKSVTFFG